ncbi:MAG: hypothetical protein M1289_02855 [Patescibacteria group bacterium]|nr:hypothetical protein [Patescibacteria group bacterium]
MNNKKLLIVIGAVVFVGLAVIVYFLFFSGKPSKRTVHPLPQVQEEVVPTLAPSDIGLSLTESPDGKKVILKISKTGDIASVDYQLSYTAKGDIPRGVIGHLAVKNPGAPIKQDIVLGTCSDVCHYDQGVKDIKLVLKVVKTNGKSYSVEQSL